MSNRNIPEAPNSGDRNGWLTWPSGMMLRRMPSIHGGRVIRDGRVDPFVTGGSTQLYPLGSELWWADRKFKYAKMGASAGVVGKLYQSVVPLAGHIDEVASGTAGNTTISFTPNTATTDDLAANELADGYIYINDDTGEGYAYRIRSHSAIVGATSGTLTLYDDIKVTLGGSATATVIHNPYRAVILHPSPPTAQYVGVTVCAVTGGDYCWLQTWGPCPVLTDGTIVVGGGVMASDNVDGSVEAWVPETDTTGEVETMPVGFVMAVNADTEYSLIDLRIS